VILKRLLMMIALTILTGSILVGCGNSASKAVLVEGKINVVTSFYPLYDFTSKIGGDYVNAINLVPAGVEPHDWSPKSRDMTNMTKAEIFVYQGAGFEGWVHDFLDSLKSDATLQIVEASKGADLIKSTDDGHGHGKEEEHGHKKEAAHTDEHKHESKEDELQYDPHAWLSPTNAKKMGENIRDALIKADPLHQADYEKNYETFAAELTSLDTRYKDAIAKTSKKEIAVSHQAFAYLCREYGLTQMPIMGLSPDSEPTAKALQEINAFIREHELKYIFFEELVSDDLAKTLAKDAKIETMVLNPLEGLTEDQLAAGEDYISIMDKNLINLLKALQ
jgi:zinc transport system substrate-binding protein